MREIAMILLGWALGIASLPIAQHVTLTWEASKSAKILLTEVRANQTYLKAYMAFKDRVDAEGRVLDGEGNLLFRVVQAQWLKPTYLRRTIFEATLQSHGLFHKSTFDEIHNFYWNIQQVERFSNAAEDSVLTEEQRVAFFRDTAKIAADALQRAETADLPRLLQAEVECSYLCRLQVRWAS